MTLHCAECGRAVAAAGPEDPRAGVMCLECVKEWCTFEPDAPGVYRTRDGKRAILSHQNTRGNWHGRIPDEMTSTWWKPTGEHILFLSSDLVAKEEPAA